MKSSTEVIQESRGLAARLLALAHVVLLQKDAGMSDEAIAAEFDGYSITKAAQRIIAEVNERMKAAQ